MNRYALLPVFLLGCLAVVRPDPAVAQQRDQAGLRASPDRLAFSLIPDSTALAQHGRRRVVDRFELHRAGVEQPQLEQEGKGALGAVIGALVALPVAVYAGRKVSSGQEVDGCIGCGIERYVVAFGIVGGGTLVGYLIGSRVQREPEPR